MHSLRHAHHGVMDRVAEAADDGRRWLWFEALPSRSRGADDGNRTRVFSLGSDFHARTGERLPLVDRLATAANYPVNCSFSGIDEGQGWRRRGPGNPPRPR
jgi:hypothetical protein